MIKVVLARHCLGFFKVTLARADAYPLPFNLKRGLPTIGVAAQVNFGSAIKQHMRVRIEFGHQRSSTSSITQYVRVLELSATNFGLVAKVFRVDVCVKSQQLNCNLRN